MKNLNWIIPVILVAAYGGVLGALTLIFKGSMALVERPKPITYSHAPEQLAGLAHYCQSQGLIATHRVTRGGGLVRVVCVAEVGQ